MTHWRTVRAWASVHATTAATCILVSVALGAVAFSRTTLYDVGLVRLVAPVSVLLLLPAVAGIGVAVAADNRARLPLPDPPRAAVARALWVLLWTGLGVLAVNAGQLTGTSADLGPITRNLLLQATLGLALVRFGYAHLAWLPPLVYTLVCMMFGYPDSGQPRYYTWAVIMQDRTTSAQWAVCGTAYLLVFLAYVLAPRRSRY